jgi:hypothetical protein
MFKDWDNFYLMLGSAAGALIGLMFVVATLTANRDRDAALRGARIYLTPIVFHFGVVLLISALTAVPDLAPVAFGGGLATVSLAGLAYGGFVLLQIGRGEIGESPHWSDLWCYGVAPCVAYAGLLVDVGGVLAGAPWATLAIAGVLTGLLLIAIRNAWDLVTFLAPVAGKKE